MNTSLWRMLELKDAQPLGLNSRGNNSGLALDNEKPSSESLGWLMFLLLCLYLLIKDKKPFFGEAVKTRV